MRLGISKCDRLSPLDADPVRRDTEIVADQPHGHARIEFFTVADQQRDPPEYSVRIRFHAYKSDAPCSSRQFVPRKKRRAGLIEITGVLCIKCPRCRVEEMTGGRRHLLSVDSCVLQTERNGIIRPAESLCRSNQNAVVVGLHLPCKNNIECRCGTVHSVQHVDDVAVVSPRKIEIQCLDRGICDVDVKKRRIIRGRMQRPAQGKEPVHGLMIQRIEYAGENPEQEMRQTKRSCYEESGAGDPASFTCGQWKSSC